MIIFNGLYFAKNKKEFEPTDQHIGCMGYYKKTKNGIQLLNENKEIFAFIVNNIKRHERLIVSANRQDDGRIRYMYALDSLSEKKLGLDKCGWIETDQILSKVIDHVFVRSNPELK